ncbi:MAG: hypothetical protein AAF149_15420 [Bacteroidota bacterium]
MNKFYVTLGLVSRYHSISEKDQLEFNSYAHFVSSLYNSFLKEVEVKNLGRVSIQLTETKKTIHIGKPSYGVSVVTKYYNVSPFFKESDEKVRKVMLLDLIHQILLEVSNALKVDESLLQHAYDMSISKNFSYEYDLINHDLASMVDSLLIKAHQSIEKIEVRLSVINNAGQIKSNYLIMSLFPVEEYAKKLFKKCREVGSQLTLIDDSGEIEFALDIENQAADIMLKPKRRSRQELEDDLAIMTYGTTKEEIEAIQQRFLQSLNS